mgnify:CR=1 FL=1
MRQMVYKKWDIYPFIERKKIKIEIEIDIATWIGIHQGDIDRVLVVALVVGAQLHIVIGRTAQFK